MLTLGVDVGVTGAVSALAEDGSYLDVHDLPLIKHDKTRWIDATEFLAVVRQLKQGQPARAVVEKTQATPKIGVITANSMGLTLGSALAVLQLAGCSIELVYPQVWKRALGLLMPGSSDSQKKNASLNLARRLYPRAPLERFADNGRAESLLIARWHHQRNAQQTLEVA